VGHTTRLVTSIWETREGSGPPGGAEIASEGILAIAFKLAAVKTAKTITDKKNQKAANYGEIADQAHSRTTCGPFKARNYTKHKKRKMKRRCSSGIDVDSHDNQEQGQVSFGELEDVWGGVGGDGGKRN